MNSKINVDIIMPVYNSEIYIKKTIDAVLNQTFQNWRLIIIDDGSVDCTKKILENYYKKIKNKKKILILKNYVNKGQAFSRNKGLKYSRSKFVSFLDSDDTWSKNKLKNQIKFMLNNNYDFTYTDYRAIKDNKIINIKVPNFYDYSKFVHDTSIVTSSIILRRKIIKKINFKNFRFLEDYYFKCQILKKKIIAIRFPGFYTNYFVRNNSLQSNRLIVLFNLWIINNKNNQMNFFQNLTSIFFIIINSIKKYGFR